MSDRYWRVNRNLGYGCRECGVHVSHVDLHDAFHDRIDRLEDRLSPPVTDRVAEPDPEPPFPMGAKVGGRESGVEWGTVTSWDFYPAWGHWFVRVDRVDDDGEPFYQLHHPSELELVPENPDTPPPAENPDKPNVAESGTEPLRCAVCGEPVGFEASPEAPPVLWHLGYKGVPVSSDHAATLTPPERAETYDADTEPPIGSVVRCEGCGNVYVHKPDGWTDTDDRAWGMPWSRINTSFCGPLRVIYTGGAAMIAHDSKCPRFPLLLTERCWFCELIARVREDERQRMALQYLVTDREQQEAEERAYERGLMDGRSEMVDGIELVSYRKGVAAAREAVVADCGCTKSVLNGWVCEHDRALAAIDALEEKP